MNIKKGLIFLMFFCQLISVAQKKDTIYGKVKSVREKLTFLDEKHQNLKLYDFESEYGHYGFMSSKFTVARFHSWWYNSPYVHYSNYYKEFNEKGKPINEIWFYKEGDTVRRYEYKYDKSNNLIQVKEIYSDKEFTSRNYTYDNNNIVTSISYDSSDPNSYLFSEYFYNEKRNLIKKKNYTDEGKSDETKYIYDSKGRKTKELIHVPYRYSDEKNILRTIKDSIGIDISSTIYFYDEFDNRIETHFYTNDKNIIKLSRKTKKIYKNKLLTKILNITFDDSISSIITYQYDKKGRKIREDKTLPLSSKNPNDKTFLIYSYDKNDNIIKLIYKDSEYEKPVKIEFKYVFDKFKNWIKQTKIVDGKELFVWTREIKYLE